MPFTFRLSVLHLVYERIRELVRRLAPKQTLLTQPADLERLEEATQEAPRNSEKAASPASGQVAEPNQEVTSEPPEPEPVIEFWVCSIVKKGGKDVPTPVEGEVPQIRQDTATLRARALCNEKGVTFVVIKTQDGKFVEQVSICNPPTPVSPAPPEPPTDGADDTSEEGASAEEDEGDAADNEVEREIERLRAETKEKERDDDSVEGGAENGSAADNETGENQATAFEDVLNQISEQTDRAELAAIAEKYPLLKRLIEAGEELDGLRYWAKSIWPRPMWKLKWPTEAGEQSEELRLASLSVVGPRPRLERLIEAGEQLEELRPRLKALHETYEADLSLPISELERWRTWRQNEWPKHVAENQQLKEAQAEPQVSKLTGPPFELRLVRCKTCEHVFMTHLIRGSPVEFCEQCGNAVAWQIVIPDSTEGPVEIEFPNRPKLHVDLLQSFTGRSFEQFLKILFQNMGFSVEETPSTMDQGADLILTDSSGRRIGVQAKRYNQDVGNTAVQEILGGMAYWGCNTGIVVSASRFTKAAKDLASKIPAVLLWDRPVLEVLIKWYMSQVVVFVAEKQPASGVPGA